MDMLHNILKWVDYNRWLIIGLILAVALSVWTVGCQPTTPSLNDPNVKVTVVALEREIVSAQAVLDKQAGMILGLESAYNSDVTAKNAAIELAQADIKRQEELRLKLIELAGGLGTTIASGGLTAPAAIATVMQLLTLFAAGGLGVDNMRKGRIIAAAKTQATAPPG